MLRKIERSERAEADLLDIWDFIADRNEPAADKLLRRFLSLFESLADRPEIGRARPELGDGVRSFPATESYGVFYAFSKSTLRILRVMHFSQDITAETFTPDDD